MIEGTAWYSLDGKKVWVAGHRGMVGAALVRRLESENVHLVTVGREHVDLRQQADVEAWMAELRPQAVFISAATVGGIFANDSRPAEFLYDNLLIAANIIEGARRVGVERLLYLGSSCIYPRLAPQPMAEDALLTGPLEPTNQWYAIAKIAGIKLCQAYRRQYGCDFISAMPSNLYGIGDNFDLTSSHVLPALLAKLHAAKVNGDDEAILWGTGKPRREFLYVDDCADALVHLMKVYTSEDHINVGTGEDVTIGELARIIAGIVGFKGRISHDLSKPDGAPRKLLDISRIKSLGWSPKTSLDDGIRRVYDWYVRNVAVAA